jgi:hypothetical protein
MLTEEIEKNWASIRLLIKKIENIIKFNNIIIKDGNILIIIDDKRDIIESKLIHVGKLKKSLMFKIELKTLNDSIRIMFSFHFGFNNNVEFKEIIGYDNIILDTTGSELLPELIEEFSLLHQEYINNIKLDEEDINMIVNYIFPENIDGFIEKLSIKTINNIFDLELFKNELLSLAKSWDMDKGNSWDMNKKRNIVRNIVRDLIFNGYDRNFLMKLKIVDYPIDQ